MRNDTTKEASTSDKNKQIAGHGSQQNQTNNNGKKRLSLNDTQLEILRPVAKYSLLVSISLVSTFILGILAGLRGIKETNTILHIISLYTAFDVIVNTICLTFQYSFNDRTFHKYCGRPFRWSQNIFEKITIQQLEKISKKQGYQGTVARALSNSVIENNKSKGNVLSTQPEMQQP